MAIKPVKAAVCLMHTINCKCPPVPRSSSERVWRTAPNSSEMECPPAYSMLTAFWRFRLPANNFITSQGRRVKMASDTQTRTPPPSSQIRSRLPCMIARGEKKPSEWVLLRAAGLWVLTWREDCDRGVMIYLSLLKRRWKVRINES